MVTFRRGNVLQVFFKAIHKPATLLPEFYNVALKILSCIILLPCVATTKLSR